MLWGRNTLSLLRWNHIWLMLIIWSDPSMFHGAVSPWSLHIYHYEAIQGQGPHFLPTRKATIHIHRGRGGRGSIWVHYIAGGWGGCLPNLDHMYIYIFYIILHICLLLKKMCFQWLTIQLIIRLELFVELQRGPDNYLFQKGWNHTCEPWEKTGRIPSIEILGCLIEIPIILIYKIIPI